MTEANLSGPRFFGKMIAANSHDVKNALAIVNENAGLLEDLVNFAEKGVPLDPQRIRGISGKIRQYVTKADRMIRNANAFAHSVDDTNGPARLEPSLMLVESMAARLIANHRVKLDMAPIREEIELPVCPFVLQHLLWLCLEFVLEAADANDTVQVTAEKKGPDINVRFGPLKHMQPTDLEELAAGGDLLAVQRLLAHRLDMDQQRQTLVLRMGARTRA